jgi:hypothetical protein
VSNPIHGESSKKGYIINIIDMDICYQVHTLKTSISWTGVESAGIRELGARACSAQAGKTLHFIKYLKKLIKTLTKRGFGAAG